MNGPSRAGEAFEDSGGAPDFGPARPHPTAGATVVGARPFLIAYNIQLSTADVDVARRMAARIRARVTSSQTVFRVWIVIYAVVGAQMAWILRPFIGTPDLPFQLFRPRSSHFFEGLWHAIQALFR